MKIKRAKKEKETLLTKWLNIPSPSPAPTTRRATRRSSNNVPPVVVKTEEKDAPIKLEEVDSTPKKKRPTTRQLLSLLKKLAIEEETPKEKRPPLCTKRRRDDIVPDVNDPNFYCKSCDRHYGSLAKFRKHLKKTHKHQLEVPPLENGRRLRVRPDILPDVDDPNWYCKSCQRHFKTHDIYRKHIKRIHEIPLKRLAPPLLYDPTIEPEIDNPDNFCRSCKKTMKNSSNYRRHLVVVHKMKLERLPKSKHDRSIQPDIDDPNFFCKSCNKSFEDRGRYRIHVQHVHKIELQPLLTHPKYVPDMELTAADIKNDSTNTFCVICKLLFSHRDRYRHHMLKHKERGNKPIKGKSKINPNIVPDVDDPDFHCKSCDYKFSCKSGYRSHLRKIHEMNLPSLL